MKKSATYSSTRLQGHDIPHHCMVAGATYGIVCVARAMWSDFFEHPIQLFDDNWEPGPLRQDFTIGRRG